MTLEEAYLRCKHESMALKREIAKLSETVEQLRKGTYTEPEKVAFLRKISELSRRLQEQEKIKNRYKTLYENEQDIAGFFIYTFTVNSNKRMAVPPYHGNHKNLLNKEANVSYGVFCYIQLNTAGETFVSPKVKKECLF